MGEFIFFIQYLFGPHLSKIGGHTAAKFSRPIIFYSAGFVLFGRIFGRLATVDGVVGGGGPQTVLPAGQIFGQITQNGPGQPGETASLRRVRVQDADRARPCSEYCNVTNNQ
jgi:hypothetical protein